MFKLELKDYVIEAPYASNDASKIAIMHKSGEGGDFNKEDLEKALNEAVDKFYKENF